MQEREQSMQAKVKEPKSFFENVWEFVHVKDTDPARTLTSGMLLKCSKNADGSQRAKDRLVVRGYNDQDALHGGRDLGPHNKQTQQIYVPEPGRDPPMVRLAS